MLGKFKALWGSGKAERKPAIPEILRLTIGRSAVIDPLLIRTRGPDSKLNIPSNSLVIVAQGMIRLEDGTFVHRFYTEDHTMLQVLSAAREGDEHIKEITLFAPLDSVYPSTEADFAAWKQRIRQTAFKTADGTKYQRYWFDNSDLPEDPVRIVETVYDDLSGEDTRTIVQTSMLFGRTLQSGDVELLLTSIEQPSNHEATVEMMVGMKLSCSDLSI
jgi:hypothetical protein